MREILKYDFNISRIKRVQHRVLLIIQNKLIMNIVLLSNRQYIMSYFFLCGLKRLSATFLLGSRGDAEYAK